MLEDYSTVYPLDACGDTVPLRPVYTSLFAFLRFTLVISNFGTSKACHRALPQSQLSILTSSSCETGNIAPHASRHLKQSVLVSTAQCCRLIECSHSTEMLAAGSTKPLKLDWLTSTSAYYGGILLKKKRMICGSNKRVRS